MLLAQNYAPDLTKVKDYLVETPLGYMVRGDFAGAGDKLGKNAKLRVDAMMDPEGAMNAGLDFLTGGAGTIGKAGKKMSRAEAEAMGLWHPISKNKLTKPFDEMTSTVIPDPNAVNAKQVTPEHYLGGVGISTKGDRTNTGTLLDINGVPLGNNGLLLEGGYKFMDSNPDANWASYLSHIKQYANKANDIVHNMGKKAYLVGTPASHQATNFNTMMSDAYLLQINNSPITKKTVKEFDEKVRSLRPEWVGLNHPKAQEQLHSNGEIRHAFNGTVELKEFQNKGMPDQASTRKALTDPELYDSPNLSGGYRIGEVAAGKDVGEYSNIITDPRFPHNSYNAQIRKASDPTTTGVQLPFGYWFPDFIAERRAAGKLPSDDARSIELSKPIQDFNQKWLDQIMPEYEKRIKGLL